MNDKKLPHDHGQELQNIVNRLPDHKTCQDAAATFQQLGDPSRLKILWLLCHCEECGVNIAAAVDMSPAAVSHHLKSLKLHGLVKSQREGKEVYYTLDDTPRAKLMHKIIDEYLYAECDAM